MAGIIGEQLVEAMIVVAEWAYAVGARGIDLLPGCWEHAVDDHWWVAAEEDARWRAEQTAKPRALAEKGV